MDATVQIKVTWNGSKVMQQLHNHLKQALFLATQEYYVTLKRLLDRWGSVRELVHNQIPIKRHGRTIAFRRTKRIFGNMRRRLVHSRPGEPPRRQTGNLYESINWQVGGKIGRLEGVIWTDVKYASELEYGGFSQNYLQVNKKYTKERLINPLPKWGYFIAPRPAWRIAFHKAFNAMLAKFTQSANLPFPTSIGTGGSFDVEDLSFSNDFFDPF